MDQLDNGFIKIYRSITKWEWYQDSPTFKVFFHLLVMANHKTKRYRGTTVKRGQLVTSYKKMALECGLSVQQVRTAIKNLVSTHEITYEGSQKGSVITVNNYTAYQATNTLDNKKSTSLQHTANTRPTTNKNVKNVKNEKNKTVGGADISPSAFKDKKPEDMTPEEKQAYIDWFRGG